MPMMRMRMRMMILILKMTTMIVLYPDVAIILTPRSTGMCKVSFPSYHEPVNSGVATHYVEVKATLGLRALRLLCCRDLKRKTTATSSSCIGHTQFFSVVYLRIRIIVRILEKTSKLKVVVWLQH